MKARIFQPAKTAMQSGRANTHQWVLEAEPTSRQALDPLMGWAGSRGTAGQIRMHFETLDEAIAFADKHAIAYTVQRAKQRAIRPRAYADNFAYDRKVPWSH